MANITRYNPFQEFVSLREAMDRLFEDSFISPRSSSFIGRGVPANLYETPEEFVLQVPMPGVNPDDVEINVHQDAVNIKWETKNTIPDNATVHLRGWQSAQYQHSFSLPAPINSDKTEASYNEGILTLRFPKAEHAKARTIKVRSVK
ncbi:HSP20 family protein [Thermosporothrix hazakensis]|jgi:HSP20 family protein|uniref:HSP20 family protein n=2 Tax=Thermosporothrix TaxID=768650 RepID=A0A326UT63_THEHA|nr:Hsp20/alpha crystallin family protein [Thermosporothrix hazakensis]PZW35903.1 HSP20 family protein [Thermosporothrix hazakensis]BBH88370.1 heat-shock protein Hsp20 [Thermosporothrix sp. COM3]GCE46557.1 heat-shock protein Hsp20 [Thermosporothrix hazakensis]